MAKQERDMGSIGGGSDDLGLTDPKATVKSDPPAPEPETTSSRPRSKRTTVSTSVEDRLRRALRLVLDNTPADAMPRPVRQEAEAAVKG